MKRIGILATGTELTFGEILNTNGQAIAQTLLNLGMPIGEHVMVDDNQKNIEAGLAFLLSRHKGVTLN